MDSTHVYWVNTGTNTIGRANIGRGGANQNLVPGITDSPSYVEVEAGALRTDTANDSIGRANLDGSGVNQSFITGLDDPQGIDVKGSDIYWADSGANRIGRANVAGMAVNRNFISGSRGEDKTLAIAPVRG